MRLIVCKQIQSKYMNIEIYLLSKLLVFHKSIIYIVCSNVFLIGLTTFIISTGNLKPPLSFLCVYSRFVVTKGLLLKF